VSDRVTDFVQEYYPHDMNDILLVDGFEDAFVGVVSSFGNKPKACYNIDTCIDILMSKSTSGEMSYEEAVEYLEFNVTQAYVGEYTPAFIRLDLGEQKI
jgi:hypothetical protein